MQLKIVLNIHNLKNTEKIVERQDITSEINPEKERVHISKKNTNINVKKKRRKKKKNKK